MVSDATCCVLAFMLANKNDITLPWRWIKNKFLVFAVHQKMFLSALESVQRVLCNCCLEFCARANDVLLYQSDFSMDSLFVHFSTFNVFISPSTQFLLSNPALQNNSSPSRHLDTSVTTRTLEMNALKLEKNSGKKQDKNKN